MSLGALSDEIGLSLAAVSRAVDGLVQRGELKRQEDPADRRSKLVSVSARGRATYERVVAVRVAGVERFVEGLEPGEREALGAAIGSDRREAGAMTARLRLNEGNRRWWTLAAMCFALFMIMLDNTVVNVALPSIQRDLGASLPALEWTVNIYTLTFAVLLVTGGRLGDILGRRRMFLFGVVVFALSSAAIGVAPDQGWLIAGRAIQGVGAAFMMPATLSIITVTFPPEERGKAIGTWAGVSALALAIGPVVGGALTEYVSWRAIFFLNLPVAVGAVAVTLFAAHESRDETTEHSIDWPGIVTLSVGLTALVLALIEGNSWGWGSPELIGLLITAAVGLVAFASIEPRVREPMVDFSLFRSKTFLGANMVGFIVSFAMLAMFFFTALYMQNILGYSAVEAGVRFLPSTLMIVLIAPLAGRLADRIGPRPPMVVGPRADDDRPPHPDAHRPRHGLRPPAPRLHRHGNRDGARDVADVHRRDERGGAPQGGRGLRHPVDEPDGRRDVRGGRARRPVPAHREERHLRRPRRQRRERGAAGEPRRGARHGVGSRRPAARRG